MIPAEADHDRHGYGVVMRPLVLDFQHLPDATLVTVVGELDATTSGQLDDFLRQARRMPGEHLVLDLSALTFIDSTGLSVLIKAQNLSRQHDGSVRLAALQPVPARLLRITGLDAHLPVYTSVGDALAAREDR